MELNEESKIEKKTILYHILLLSILSLILYISNTQNIGFEGKDEYRYAEVAKEVSWGTNLFVMHYDGEPYPDKPPLFFWIVKLLYIIGGGISPFNFRIYCILCGIAGIIITYFIALKLYNDKNIALFSGLFLMIASRYFWGTRWARLDIPFCFFIYLAMFSFVLWYFDYKRNATSLAQRIVGNAYMRSSQEEIHTSNPFQEGTLEMNLALNQKRKNLYIYLFWIFLALGTLTKGPLGIIIPIGSILLFLILNKDLKSFLQTKLLIGVIIVIVLVGIWLIPAIIMGGKNYSNDLIFQQNITRLVSPWRHKQPIYYFWGKLFIDFLPGILFLPSALIIGLQKKNFKKDIPFLFNFSWFTFTLIFFSFSPSKRGQYVLPMYPAMAMLVSSFLFINKNITSPIKYKKIPLYVFTTIGVIAAIILPFITHKINKRFGINLNTFGITLLVLFSLSSLLLIFIVTLKNKLKHCIIFTIILMIIIYIFLIFRVFPSEHKETLDKQFAQLIESYRYDNKINEIVIYEDFNPRLIIYGNYFIKNIIKEDEFKNILLDNQRRLVLIYEDNIEKFRNELSNIELVKKFQMPDKNLFIYKK